ncbi:MAG: SMC-Scp complex subunit ScpB [Endomicrobium sp.]|jgi:segregation and condensation protein B|nr:SMC-Scp complex subunit ScpB [Endomicrobium sp.]
MEISEVKQTLEALLFVSERPLSLKELKDIVKEDYADTANLENLLRELQTEYENLNKPFEIKFVADGWTFATKASFSPWIKKLLKEKSVLKLSPSALETLAMVAYKQPITRAEIDELRGVESSGVINTLSERKLIKVVGRKEAVGHPLLYGTTQDFLKHFGLAHLSELPLIETLPKEAQATSNAPEPELPFDSQKDQSVSDGQTETPMLPSAETADESIADVQVESESNSENVKEVLTETPMLPSAETADEFIADVQAESETKPENVKEVLTETSEEL